MLNKDYTNRLIKVCKVLFPKYKHIHINRRNSTVTLRTIKFSLFRIFSPKTVMTLAELINYRIPRQLADFKYGDEKFVTFIQDDMIKCELLHENTPHIERFYIDYFLDEIRKVKFADAYKQMKLPSSVSTVMHIEEPDNSVYEDMIEVYNTKKKNKIDWISSISTETWFYLALLTIIACSLIF